MKDNKFLYMIGLSIVVLMLSACTGQTTQGTNFIPNSYRPTPKVMPYAAPEPLWRFGALSREIRFLPITSMASLPCASGGTWTIRLLRMLPLQTGWNMFRWCESNN